VAAARRAGAHQLVADLCGQLDELRVGEVAQVARAGDPVELSHDRSV